MMNRPHDISIDIHSSNTETPPTKPLLITRLPTFHAKITDALPPSLDLFDEKEETAQTSTPDLSASDDKPIPAQTMLSQEKIKTLIETMRKLSAPIDMVEFRTMAIGTFSLKIDKFDDLVALNKEFDYFRKLDQLALDNLHIPYNRTIKTPQRAKALNEIKGKIIQAYKECTLESLSIKEAFELLKESVETNSKAIKDDYAKTSWYTGKLYSYSLGLLFNPGESQVAKLLDETLKNVEKISAENNTPAPAMTSR